LSREDKQKREYSRDIRNLLDQPVRNYKDALLLSNYLSAVVMICELSDWNVDEILGGDGNMGLHKMMYTRLTHDTLNEPVDTPHKAIFAQRILEVIEKDCKKYGWNMIEILGGVVYEEKEETETQSVNPDLGYASA